ncbi:restriction endonuclease subunit S [Paracidovorax cattleyae]|nr:restriction endonuclease subunit S [Paracidovorax cattleyae]
MSSEWAEATLGKFVRLQRGHDLTAAEQEPGNVPVMGSAGPNGTHSKSLAKGPGVVIGRSGASAGKVHFIEVDYWPHNTCLYVTDFLGNNPRFAFYLLQMLDLGTFNSGSAQPSLNRNFIYSIPLKVPDVDEQDAIVSVLQALDDRITLLRETNATLEALAQALFKSWFVDFDPVRAKMAGRAPEGMDEATVALFPDALEETGLGVVPKGWSVKILADVTTYLNRGISPKYVDDGGLLVLNQKCVRDFSIDWSKGRRHDPSHRKVDGRLLEKGDVLVNSTGVGTLGRVGQILDLPEPAIVDSHVTVVRAGEAVSWPYLGQWMQSRQGHIEAMGEGSTGQTELSRSKLGSMPLLVPTGAVLAAFDAAVLPLKARISCNADTAQSLSMLRDTLLPRLISGQLRLPEAQSQLEAAA